MLYTLNRKSTTSPLGEPSRGGGRQLHETRHAVQGSINSTPVSVKFLPFRVAQLAPCALQMAAIWESAVWIGCPARSRMTRMSAYRESDNDLHTTEERNCDQTGLEASMNCGSTAT